MKKRLRGFLCTLGRLTGISAYDRDTQDCLSIGCPTAEREAALRYGDKWRETESAKRATERLRRWPRLSRFINANDQVERPQKAKAETLERSE